MSLYMHGSCHFDRAILGLAFKLAILPQVVENEEAHASRVYLVTPAWCKLGLLHRAMEPDHEASIMDFPDDFPNQHRTEWWSILLYRAQRLAALIWCLEISLLGCIEFVVWGVSF